MKLDEKCNLDISLVRSPFASSDGNENHPNISMRLSIISKPDIIENKATT